MSSSCKLKRVKSHKVLVANFTNGHLKAEKSQGLSFKHYTDNEGVVDDKNSRHVLVAETTASTCHTYLGDSMGEAAPSKLYNYYVGVRNKRTGKMKVYDSELFNMIPQVKVEKQSETTTEVLPLSYTDKMKELTKAFGSTKRQRLVEQSQKNAITGDVLDSAIGSAVVHAVSLDNFTEITTHKSIDESKDCVPLHDLEAKTPEDIYTVNRIIGKKEMGALTNICQKLYGFKHDEFDNSDGFGTYIMNRLPILPLDEDRRWEKCKCLMYIHFLITLYKKKASELKVKEILPKDWPDIVKSSIIQKFTLKVEGVGTRRSVRCMSIRMKDKIILHVLVLCLIVDNYTLEYSDITKDLRIGEKRMPLLLRSVGCQIKSRVINKIQVRTAHLIAPLHLPEQTLITGKRKK